MLVLLFLLALVVQAATQATVICVKGSKSCDMVQLVKDELKLFCADKMDWTWGLIEPDPDGSIRIPVNAAENLVSDTALTSLAAKRTWLNSAAFDYGKNRPRLHRTIAHELAHIRLNTTDENKADAEAPKILKAVATGRCP